MYSSENNGSPAGSLREAGTSILALSDAREIENTQTVSTEIGVLLIVSGIAGIILPGPVGTPLLILGCVIIWPKSFKRVNMFFARRFPRAHQLGALQSRRFLNDLERRYPVSR